MAAATDPNSQYLSQQLAASSASRPMTTAMPKNTISQKTTGVNGVPTTTSGALDSQNQTNNQNTAAPTMTNGGLGPFANGGIGDGSGSTTNSTTTTPNSSTNPDAWWQQTGSTGSTAATAATAAANNTNGGTNTVTNPYLSLFPQPAYSAHLGSDPYLNSALSNLSGVANGTNVPYTQAVQDSMMSSASDTNAAAEGGQSQMLRNQAAMNGGTLADPSSQAALQQLAANRQGANATAQQNISMTADQANFAAEQAANNSIAQTRLGEANADPMGIGQANNGGLAISTQNGTAGTGTLPGTTTGAPGTGVTYPGAVPQPGAPAQTYPGAVAQPGTTSGTTPAGWSRSVDTKPAVANTADTNTAPPPATNPALQSSINTLFNTGSTVAGNQGTGVAANQLANFNANSNILQQEVGSSMTSQAALQNPNAFNQAALAQIAYSQSPAGQAAYAAQMAASRASQASLTPGYSATAPAPSYTGFGGPGTTPAPAMQWVADANGNPMQIPVNTAPPAGFKPISSGPAAT